MSIFVLSGILIVSLFVMVGMLVRQNANMEKGLATLPPQVGRTGISSRIFSRAHDLEQTLLHISFRAGGHIFEHTRTLFRRGVHALFHKTPMKKISDAVSGRSEVHKGNTEPSTYLKDMTDHRDQMRESGSRE